MARCPACKKHFAVLEDEDPSSHGCPRCGYGTEPDSYCLFCNVRLNPRDDDHIAHYPYCSNLCAVAAEVDSPEDEDSEPTEPETDIT